MSRAFFGPYPVIETPGTTYGWTSSAPFALIGFCGTPRSRSQPPRSQAGGARPRPMIPGCLAQWPAEARLLIGVVGAIWSLAGC